MNKLTDWEFDHEGSHGLFVLESDVKFAHWCGDWDYMAICEEDSEFGACSCEFEDNTLADEWRAYHQRALDAYNEAKELL